MPFDGATRRSSLQECLDSLGLRPIDESIINKHKAEQVRRHPPSWAYNHLHELRAVLAYSKQIALAISVCSGMTAVGMLAAAIFTVTIVTRTAMLSALGLWVGSFIIAAAINHVMNTVRVRGPAVWRERWFTTPFYPPRGFDDAPVAVKALVKRVHAAANVHFVYGELYQGSLLLDPYVGVLDGETRKVLYLAVWDGDEILYIA